MWDIMDRKKLSRIYFPAILDSLMVASMHLAMLITLVMLPQNAALFKRKKCLYQISAQLLLSFNRLKERLEIAGSEAGEVISLDNLDKDGRPIHQVLPLYQPNCVSEDD